MGAIIFVQRLGVNVNACPHVTICGKVSGHRFKPIIHAHFSLNTDTKIKFILHPFSCVLHLH